MTNLAFVLLILVSICTIMFTSGCNNPSEPIDKTTIVGVSKIAVGRLVLVRSEVRKKCNSGDLDRCKDAKNLSKWIKAIGRFTNSDFLKGISQDIKDFRVNIDPFDGVSLNNPDAAKAKVDTSITEKTINEKAEILIMTKGVEAEVLKNNGIPIKISTYFEGLNVE